MKQRFDEAADTYLRLYDQTVGEAPQLGHKLERAKIVADTAYRTALLDLLSGIRGELLQISNSDKAAVGNFHDVFIPAIKPAMAGLARLLPPEPFVQDGKSFGEPGLLIKALEALGKGFDHLIEKKLK